MLRNHHQISFLYVFSLIIAVIPYLVLLMSTAHVHSVNFLYVESLKSVKIASSVPKGSNGKRPACLGQLGGGKLKKLVGVFLLQRSIFGTPSNGPKRCFIFVASRISSATGTPSLDFGLTWFSIDCLDGECSLTQNMLPCCINFQSAVSEIHGFQPKTTCQVRWPLFVIFYDRSYKLARIRKAQSITKKFNSYVVFAVTQGRGTVTACFSPHQITRTNLTAVLGVQGCYSILCTIAESWTAFSNAIWMQ